MVNPAMRFEEYEYPEDGFVVFRIYEGCFWSWWGEKEGYGPFETIIGATQNAYEAKKRYQGNHY